MDYTFPVAGCVSSYGRSHHDYPAADMFAARGCLFVAPVDGLVDEVQPRDTWDHATNLALAPQPYLDSWRAGEEASPAAAVAAAAARVRQRRGVPRLLLTPLAQVDMVL